MEISVHRNSNLLPPREAEVVILWPSDGALIEFSFFGDRLRIMHNLWCIELADYCTIVQLVEKTGIKEVSLL